MRGISLAAAPGCGHNGFVTGSIEPGIVNVSVCNGRGFFQTLARWWWLELLVIILLPAALGYSAWRATHDRPPVFRSTALLEMAPPQDGLSSGALMIHLRTRAGLITTAGCLRPVAEELDLAAKWRLPDQDAALAKLAKQIRVHPVGRSLLLRLSADAEDAALARDLAAATAGAFLRLNQRETAGNGQDAGQRQTNPGGDSFQARTTELHARTANLESRLKALENGTHEALLAEAELASPPNPKPAALIRDLANYLEARGQHPAESEENEESADLDEQIATIRGILKQETELARATLRGSLAQVKGELEALGAIAAQVRTRAPHADAPAAILRDPASTPAQPICPQPCLAAAAAAVVGLLLAFDLIIPLALLLEGFSANRRMKKANAALAPPAT